MANEKSKKNPTHIIEEQPTQPNQNQTGGNTSESAGLNHTRTFRGNRSVVHDLFKLLPATMIKNVSYTDNPLWENFEHCHMFHTIDSSGKAQSDCAAVGGHYHSVKVIPAKDENSAPSLVISGPMKKVRRLVNPDDRTEGYEIVDLPVSKRDNHTHSFVYLGSEKIEIRKVNVEAAKVNAAIRSRQEITVEGVMA